MKKLIFALFAVIASAFVFSACSSSSNDTPNLGSVVAGNYDVTITNDDDESDTNNSFLVITRLSDNTASFTLGEITFSPVTLSGTTTTVNLAGTATQSVDGDTSIYTFTGSITAEGVVNLSMTAVETSAEDTETYHYTISGAKVSGETPETITIADGAAGTYDVSLIVHLEAQGETTTEGPIAATVVITKVSDTSIDLELQGFEISEGFEIPVSMTGINLSGTSAAIEIAETTQTINVEALEGMLESTEIDVTVSGTIENQSVMTLNISLPITMLMDFGGTTITMPMTVTVDATGTKQ